MNIKVHRGLDQIGGCITEISTETSRVFIDFGQNHAGVPVIDTSLLKEGETITIRSAEILDKNGNLYRGNLRKAKSTIVYKKGRDYGEYTPPFTYMGFRYLEISGVEYREGLIKSRALYTSMERTGYFKCGNEDINKLYENIIWGQKSNYVEVPTDCPQRDERMGWTGDAEVFAPTACYLRDCYSFLNKYLFDLCTEQKDMDGAETILTAKTQLEQKTERCVEIKLQQNAS